MEEQSLEVVEDQRLTAPLGTDRPSDVITRAVEIADVLKPIILQKKLFKTIGEKDHVMAEGWAVLMGLINVDPIVDYSRKIEREGEIAYEARVSLVHHGRVVSAAETIASDKEKGSWARSEQGVKSMAQTRAFGKACRLKYSWIMVMAGYAPTAAEEFSDERQTIQQPKAKSADRIHSDSRPVVSQETRGQESWPEPPPEEIPFPDLPVPKAVKTITEKQRKMIWAKCRSAEIPENVFKAYIKENFHTEHTADLPWQSMDKIIKWIDAYQNLNQVGN